MTTISSFESGLSREIVSFDSKEAIEATDYFVKLVKEGGTPQWSTYTWIDCQQDFGARKAAICWDCDTTYIYMNYPDGSPEAGNLKQHVLSFHRVQLHKVSGR